jgi:L-lactate dehydrogenase complex protein LldG
MKENTYLGFKEKVEALGAEVYLSDAHGVAELMAKIVRDVANPVVGLASSSLTEELGLGENLKRQGISVYQEDLAKHGAEINIGLSELDLGIAETGTLAQDASDLGKRIVSMLPEVHIALIRKENMVATLDDALKYFQSRGAIPGYVAFVSGPSRTADIERVLSIGVHGPKRLVILVIAGEGTVHE